MGPSPVLWIVPLVTKESARRTSSMDPGLHLWLYLLDRSLRTLCTVCLCIRIRVCVSVYIFLRLCLCL